MENLNVKLLICYHKPDKLFKDDILTPIHVGRAQAKKANNPNLAWLEANMIGDDTADNISLKNYCYNELTAPYWAWKNYGELGNPDYIGLMHYRRHFIFDASKEMGVVEYDGMNEYYAESINYTRENVEKLLRGNDIVYYKGRVDNIYKHYCENHKKEDLDLALKLIDEMSPEYSATAKAYVKGDVGCFCNMAIFSKEMFFEYCEWIFPILDAFFNRVDMSEKRFFISERLTGIFIAKKISEGKKTVSLASSFVKTEYRIPVVIPFEEGRVLETAATLQSFVVNADEATHLDFHVLHDNISEQTKKELSSVVADREDFKINFIDIAQYCRETGIEDVIGRTDYYPFIIGGVLPTVGKCLYVTRNVLIMKDVEEFFRLCSVDDFWIAGAGVRKDDTLEWFGTSCVINTRRFVDHKVAEAFMQNYKDCKNATEIIEKICKDQFSLYADWFWVNADESALLIPDDRRRGELQSDATWHPMICYREKAHPAANIQAVYSNFWWNIVASITKPIAFDLDYSVAVKQLDDDQIVMNAHKIVVPGQRRESMLKKAKAYYKKFGFKATFKRFFEKLSGR